MASLGSGIGCDLCDGSGWVVLSVLGCQCRTGEDLKWCLLSEVCEINSEIGGWVSWRHWVLACG